MTILLILLISDSFKHESIFYYKTNTSL